jgi:uncharacterized protein (DUF2062 family)
MSWLVAVGSVVLQLDESIIGAVLRATVVVVSRKRRRRKLQERSVI